MRHRRDVKKFGRKISHRRAMFRNMLNSLIAHERITTTDAKAKELRRHADRLVTLSKRSLGKDAVSPATLQRRAFDWLRDRESVGKLFGTLAPRYQARSGGYTRIVKLGFRQGDNAPLARIEFVESGAEAAPTGGKKKKKPAAKKEAKAEPKAEA
ncbi:MAG: 50S ribosomal protein L17, partial [Bdellovibrionota bacterium]